MWSKLHQKRRSWDFCNYNLAGLGQGLEPPMGRAGERRKELAAERFGGEEFPGLCVCALIHSASDAQHLQRTD